MIKDDIIKHLCAYAEQDKEWITPHESINSHAVDLIESQSKEIVQLKKFNDLDMKQIAYLIEERSELIGALTIAVDALNLSDVELANCGKNCYTIRKALVRCKDVLK